MNVLNNSSTKHNDVLVEHLDYRYIDKCQNAKEMERIVKVLRSGREGRYQDLETHAEKKLESLNPQSKVLRKSQPISTPQDLDKDEWEILDNDIKDWSTEMKSKEDGLKQSLDVTTDLPPVRGTGKEIPIQTKSETTQKPKSKKRVKPREYSEWEKVDIDGELAKVEAESGKQNNVKNVLKSPAVPQIPQTVDTVGLTTQERQQKAEREKNKGNEAFQAGDLDEALLYYNRSLSIVSTVAAHNNRAQTYIKLKKWDQALLDCNLVLSLEANNIKALLRRAVAFQGQRKYVNAQQDLQKVLDMEPPNKRAKDLLKEVEVALAEQKAKGRRLIIEEFSGSDSESEPRTSDSEDEEPENLGQVNGNVNEEEKLKLDQSEKEEVKTTVPGDTETKTESETKVDRSSQPVDTDSDSGDDTVDGPCFSKRESNVDTDTAAESTATKPAVDNINTSPNHPPEPPSEQTTVPARTPEQPTQPQPPLVEPLPLPPVVEANKLDGNILFKAGQYAEAINQYTTAIHLLAKENNAAQNSNLSLLYTNRATCSSKIGDCIGCIDDCNRALELTPGALKPLLRRALAYETIEKYSQAYVGFRHVLRMDPNADVAQQGSTRCQRMLQLELGNNWREKLPDAPSIPATAFNVTPPSVTPVQLSAPVQADQGQGQGGQGQGHVKAQGQVKEKPKHQVTTPKPVPEVSAKAKAEFDKLKTLGNNLVQKGEFKVAADCYTRCIAACPHEVAPYTNRALCYLKLGQSEKVLEDCEKALELQPDNAKALFRKAQAYKLQDKYEDCRRTLETLLTVDPKNSAAKKELEQVQEQIQKQVAESRGRQRVKIQEVEESSDEEEDGDGEKEFKEEAGKARQTAAKTTPVTASKQQQQQQQKQPSRQSSQKQNNSKQQQTKQSPGGATGAKSSPPTAPRLEKVTGYEFLQAWASLKACQDVEPYVELLTQVAPEQLPSVISNKLEGPMLSHMIRCVKCLINRGQVKEAAQYLKYLAQVERFQMISMFMSQEEKKDITSIFESLLSQSDSEVSACEVPSLRQKYGV